jgi:5-methylcytosine-specific restriction endonuclease McrA
MKRGSPLRRTGRLSRVGARARREQEAWTDGKAAALQRAGGRCEWCGERRSDLHVHHVVSRARAPGWALLHDPSNLKALCFFCHDAAHRDPAAFPDLIRSKP